jgi:recombination protein RecR
MDSLNRLQELFAHFPGIGPRQAKRFVYYLLNKSPSFIREFTQLVEEVRKATSECIQCHRLFIGGNHSSNVLLCSICSDTSRDSATLMIVARDSDFETVEKSGAYRGLYFILGGTIPILDKEPEKRVRLDALLKHVSSTITLKEIILSMNTTPDGENTASVVKDTLKDIAQKSGMKISLLGRGLSTGAELEYVDGDTIRSALKNRG